MTTADPPVIPPADGDDGDGQPSAILRHRLAHAARGYTASSFAGLETGWYCTATPPVAIRSRQIFAESLEALLEQIAALPMAIDVRAEAEAWCDMYYALASQIMLAGYMIAYPEGMGGAPVLAPHTPARG